MAQQPARKPAKDSPAIEDQIVEVSSSSSLATVLAADIDSQVATAKRYPRSVVEFTKKGTGLVTLTEEVAQGCFYTLPARRGGDGKPIQGPSARFAEIIASAWGNLRIEGRPIREEDRFVVSRGTAWDLETNVAIAFEVRRRITTKDGGRFGDDMIGVTSVAATSIALRNAALKVIPKALWEPLYLAARKTAIGDAKTLVSRRAATMERFGKMGVTPDRIFAALKIKGLEDVTIEHLEILFGMFTAIKEGDLGIDEAFAGPVVEADAIDPEHAPKLAELFATLNYSAAQQTVKLQEFKGRTGELVEALTAEINKKPAEKVETQLETPTPVPPDTTTKPATDPPTNGGKDRWPSRFKI